MLKDTLEVDTNLAFNSEYRTHSTEDPRTVILISYITNHDMFANDSEEITLDLLLKKIIKGWV